MSATGYWGPHRGSLLFPAGHKIVTLIHIFNFVLQSDHCGLVVSIFDVFIFSIAAFFQDCLLFIEGIYIFSESHSLQVPGSVQRFGSQSVASWPRCRHHDDCLRECSWLPCEKVPWWLRSQGSILPERLFCLEVRESFVLMCNEV